MYWVFDNILEEQSSDIILFTLYLSSMWNF